MRATLRVRGPDGERSESFDQLVIATGATPVRPDLPGADAAGIHGIQTIADGIALREEVDAGVIQAVVVGRRVHRAGDGGGAASPRARRFASSSVPSSR